MPLELIEGCFLRGEESEYCLIRSPLALENGTIKGLIQLHVPEILVILINDAHNRFRP